MLVLCMYACNQSVVAYGTDAAMASCGVVYTRCSGGDERTNHQGAPSALRRKEKKVTAVTIRNLAQWLHIQSRKSQNSQTPKAAFADAQTNKDIEWQ
jgi:hypothetical protein